MKEKSFLSLEKYQVTNLNLNSKEDVRVLCFPESVKEEGEVVVVVQGLKGYLIVEKLKNDMTDEKIDAGCDTKEEMEVVLVVVEVLIYSYIETDPANERD